MRGRSRTVPLGAAAVLTALVLGAAPAAAFHGYHHARGYGPYGPPVYVTPRVYAGPPVYVAPPVYAPPPVMVAPPPMQALPATLPPAPPGAAGPSYPGTPESSCLMVREYLTEIEVGGRTVQGYGYACLQPDGSWRRGAPAPAGMP